MKDAIYHEFIKWCEIRHNEECNQKYDGLPYSKHLDWVMSQARLFKHLIPAEKWWLVLAACAGHDLIEDARVTYNDLVERSTVELAEIIYACTEEKGKDRTERHSGLYYMMLADNPLAIFVKLCDIIANVKYSILTNSTMLVKHRNEHIKTKNYLLHAGIKYKDMFVYLDDLFKLEIKRP